MDFIHVHRSAKLGLMVLDFCAARSENDVDLMIQLDCPEPPTQMTWHFVGFCLPKMVA